MIAYLLLCGYPPFYSSGGKNLSDRMKENIIGGKYEFDPLHWNRISNDAKLLIQQMLIVDPKERIEIELILRSSWFNQSSSIQIDLTSIKDQNNRLQFQVIDPLLFFFSLFRIF